MNSFLKSFICVVVGIVALYGFAWCSINKESIGETISQRSSELVESFKQAIGQDSLSLAKKTQRKIEEEKAKEREKQEKMREKELADWKVFSKNILEQLPIKMVNCENYLEDCLAEHLKTPLKFHPYGIVTHIDEKKWSVISTLTSNERPERIQVLWDENFNIQILIPQAFYDKARQTSGITKEFPQPPHPYNTDGLEKLKAAFINAERIAEEKEEEQFRQDSIQEAEKEQAAKVAYLKRKEKEKKELAIWEKYCTALKAELTEDLQCDGYIIDCIVESIESDIEKTKEYSWFHQGFLEEVKGKFIEGKRILSHRDTGIKVIWFSNNEEIKVQIPYRIRWRAHKKSGVKVKYSDIPHAPHRFNYEGKKKLRGLVDSKRKNNSTSAKKKKSKRKRRTDM